MATQFEFKAAPVGGRRILTVDDDNATLQGGSDEEKSRVDYAKVDAARFVITKVRYTSVRRLDLRSGEEMFRLSVNKVCH